MKAVVVDNLRAGMRVARDIFLSENASLPFIKADTILTASMISELERRGVSVIHTHGPKAPQPTILSTLPRVERKKTVISSRIKEQALTSLSDAFSAFSIAEGDIHESSKIIINRIDNVVESLVDTLQMDENAIVSINDLKSFDDYTFHHSLSVAVLSIAIAQQIGFGANQIHEIGMCAMMHDIGKTAVPIHIINKPSRLNDAEFSIIQTHPHEGVGFLDKLGLCGDNILRGVLHHHEKFDGSGYPGKLRGEDIPIYSRILAIADVYDALTSNRPYRMPMQPSEAIEYIMGGAQSSFDYDLINVFIKKIELYPVGTLVELSNGMIGIVLGNENQLRPLVKTTSGALLDLEWDRMLLNVVVKRALPDDYS